MARIVNDLRRLDRILATQTTAVDACAAGHAFADATIYGIALYAVGKPNSAKRGADFISGIFQGVLGLSVASDVIRRSLFGSEPTSPAMITVGAAALAANVTCLWLLRK